MVHRAVPVVKRVTQRRWDHGIRRRENLLGCECFFSSRRRHTRLQGDWSSDVCSSDLDDTTDDVDREMEAKHRSFWVRGFREQYDAALLYHDSVIAKTLDLMKTSESSSDYQAWMYLSDHGQEVGHLLNKVGHSPSTESGYRIPT